MQSSSFLRALSDSAMQLTEGFWGVWRPYYYCWGAWIHSQVADLAGLVCVLVIFVSWVTLFYTICSDYYTQGWEQPNHLGDVLYIYRAVVGASRDLAELGGTAAAWIRDALVADQDAYVKVACLGRGVVQLKILGAWTKRHDKTAVGQVPFRRRDEGEEGNHRRSTDSSRLEVRHIHGTFIGHAVPLYTSYFTSLSSSAHVCAD